MHVGQHLLKEEDASIPYTLVRPQRGNGVCSGRLHRARHLHPSALHMGNHREEDSERSLMPKNPMLEREQAGTELLGAVLAIVVAVAAVVGLSIWAVVTYT